MSVFLGLLGLFVLIVLVLAGCVAMAAAFLLLAARRERKPAAARPAAASPAAVSPAGKA
ncbi:MAG: hypothetical protein ACYDH5_18150 [Acidimicrobiales bacterium]